MNEKKDTFANRLSIAMEENNINQIELSEKTNIWPKKISQSLINKYLKGKAFARQDNIYILAKILNVNEAWLMGYDVPKKRMNDNESNYLTFIAQDDSMAPLLNIGDVAYICDQNHYDDGNTILFEMNGEKYIRKVNTKDGYIEFRAMNPYYPLIVLKNDELEKCKFKVIGKVIKAENQSAFK